MQSFIDLQFSIFMVSQSHRENAKTMHVRVMVSAD